MNYITNAFSINVLERVDTHIHFVPISREEVPAHLPLVCAIGHADTAALVSADLDMRLDAYRMDVRLRAGDTLIVAQYSGPRLPEGTTELPEGARIEYWRANIVN